MCFYVLANPDAWIVIHYKGNSSVKETVCQDYNFRALRFVCLVSMFDCHEFLLLCD
jgi:hypothetical protein